MLVWQRSPILQKEISSNNLAGIISLLLWEATTRRASLQLQCSFPTGTLSQHLQVFTLSSPSTGYRNDDQTSMSAKHEGSNGRFSLVLSDGQHQRQRASKHQWGWKDFCAVMFQLKPWSSSVHFILNGYWYKSIFLKKMWKQTRNRLCRFPDCCINDQEQSDTVSLQHSLNFTIDNRYLPASFKPF